MNSPVRLSRFTRGDSRRIDVSFEFFPPNGEEMEKILWESIERLAPLAPNFVSVTYGAGGSTRERTHATVKRILAETPLTPAAHLTCVAATREEIDAIVRNYHEAGVRHIVALRGDPVERRGRAIRAASGRLQQRRRSGRRHQAHRADFEISVSAYPEKHPDSPTVEADIDMLKAKVDAGASRAITQFFFENDLYFRYLDRVRARGIDIPIVPGILPVQNFKADHRFRHALRRFGAGLAGRAFPRPRSRSGDAQADRRRGRRRAGDRPGRPRRHHVPFLHHESRRSRLRDLSSAGPAAGGGASGVIVRQRFAMIAPAR